MNPPSPSGLRRGKPALGAPASVPASCGVAHTRRQDAGAPSVGAPGFTAQFHLRSGIPGSSLAPMKTRVLSTESVLGHPGLVPVRLLGGRHALVVYTALTAVAATAQEANLKWQPVEMSKEI